ncbi:hypothetical protein ACVWY3_007642 [Bradyrhizobium sp. USDA 4486]
MTESLAGGAAAAPLSLRAAATFTSAAVRAARQLLAELGRGRRIDAAVLRSAMEAAFGAADATGAWNWKTAYDVCEAAAVLFLCKFGPAMRARAGATAAMLPMRAKIASCLPTHTRRSEDSQALQRFSTPIPLALPLVTAAAVDVIRHRAKSRSTGAVAPRSSSSSISAAPEGVELAFEVAEWSPPEGVRLTDALYREDGLQSIHIPGSRMHPTILVQSAAMASVAPPKPTYRPHLPSSLVADGLLSNAQLESVIYAGEAHSEFLAGSWTVDATFEVVAAARDDAENAIRFRRGWFLGDGTGAGKGRQVTGILLDNWLKGSRWAVWISKSDKLIEEAQPDWSALGMERLLVTPLCRFSRDTPIRLSEGILFTTYATLRTDERGEKLSRVRQIVEWLGSDFDGVIVFDESHAIQNAVGGRAERGDQAASQQGRAGLRLQHALPNARVVYVSATGATTVHNLAYAQRVGLWGGADFPFATRVELVEAIEQGGVAAMEVLARDLTMRDRLRAYGLFGEIISWKLRIFVPTDSSGVEILSRVLGTYPVARISAREAA